MNSIDAMFASTNQPQESVMKAIAKVVAPVTLAFAAFSANAAGLIEIDYPQHEAAATAVTHSAPSASSGANTLSWPVSEAAPVVNTIESAAAPSREEVMRKAAEPRAFDIGYFA
jgi:hypothetical protein